MIALGTKDAPRELKPGDLYVVTGDQDARGMAFIELGEIREFVVEGDSKDSRLKLVCRHPCGALEFLVLPPEPTP